MVFIITAGQWMIMQMKQIKTGIKKRVQKADLLLIGILLLAGLAGMVFVGLQRKDTGTAVVITVDGAVYGTYDLSKDQTIPIKPKLEKTSNTLEISDGRAKMTAADCPDKLCMHQKAAAKQGETIVCLPNKVVVEVQGEGQAEIDAVSQ